MKRILTPLLLSACFAAAPVWAADTQDHEAHHPGASTPFKPAPKAKPAKADGALPMQCMQMQQQMKDMQAMHEKFMNAKTPEERKALMDEHMKSMQSGMAMMGNMGKEKESTDNPMHMQMRMDMMEMMMQMMMDRMSVMPTK